MLLELTAPPANNWKVITKLAEVRQTQTWTAPSFSAFKSGPLNSEMWFYIVVDYGDVVLNWFITIQSYAGVVLRLFCPAVLWLNLEQHRRISGQNHNSAEQYGEVHGVSSPCLNGLVWNFTARCLFLICYILIMTKILLSKLQNRQYVARNHILFTKFVLITEMFLFMCYNDLFCTY